MPKYRFFAKNNEIAATESTLPDADFLNEGYEKIDFETDAEDKEAAINSLKNYLSQNTDATKKYTGDITFSSIIESLLR